MVHSLLYTRRYTRSLLRCLHSHREHQRLVGPYRTHYVGQIKQTPPGTRVRVCGRVSHVRPLGHINFILLTDHNETVQAVWKRGPASNPDLFAQIKSLRQNSFCSLMGTVTNRNEIALEHVDVLSVPDSALTRWPIQSDTGEDLRLKLRFLDLREPELQRRLKLRSRAMHTIRSVLQSLQFTEIETPILTASSPEGAREFLVPSRRAGQFFALSQSPQQYKQLLMAGGFERYFQFARCFRDEDGRSDRQSEFTQIDVEMAYIGVEQVIDLTENMMRTLSESLPEMQLQFPGSSLPRYSYDYVIKNYGSDKPDLRTRQMTLHDISDGWTAILCKQMQDLPIGADLKGIYAFAVPESYQSTYNGSLPDHIVDLCQRKLNAEPGDCVIASRDRLSLGAARNQLIPWLHERGLLEFEQNPAWLWVTEFPLFERGSRSTLQSCHHPFTAPVDVDQLYSVQHDIDKLLMLKAQSYDLVVNGIELGGGSLRIHDYNVQKLVLSLLGSKDNSSSFQALVSALRYGCPPHGGIALGFDRMMSEFPTSAASLREAIAFPKSSLGRDLMMDAPGSLYDEEGQLGALGLRVRKCASGNRPRPFS